MTPSRRLGGSVLLCALLVGLAACASSGNAGGSSGGPLTRDVLIGTGQSDLYQAVRMLRPQWLRARGRTSIQQAPIVMLYVNDTHFGDVASLTHIPIDSVVEIRFMSASDAANRFGTSAGSSGAVMVSTRMN